MKGLKRWSQPLGMFASCPGEFEDFTKCFIDVINYENLIYRQVIYNTVKRISKNLGLTII